MSVRKALIIAISVILAVGVFYKLYEWKTLSELVNLYNSTWSQELKLTSEYSVEVLKTDKLNKQLEKENIPRKEYERLYWERNAAYNLSIDSTEEYLNMLKEHLKKYKRKKEGIYFILGKKRDLGLNLIDLQEKYYNLELEAQTDTLGYEYLSLDLINVENERLITQEHSEKLSSYSEKDPNVYFEDLTAIEKYTDPNFKFDKEDLIKKYYPKGFDVLDRYKNYFDSYYRIIKDFAKSDEESAAYKLQRLIDTAAELNIDRNQVFLGDYIRTGERQKNIVKSIVDQIDLIKKIERDKTFNYPFFPAASFISEDIAICQAYHYKTYIFRGIVNKYPQSSRIHDYVKELNEVSPKTEKIDRNIDSKAITLINGIDEIRFQCLDKLSGKKLIFEILKTN